MWTDEEIKQNAKCSCNTQGYTDRKDSTVQRFFNTIMDFGSPGLQPLCTIYKDEFGVQKRYVLSIHY